MQVAHKALQEYIQVANENERLLFEQWMYNHEPVIQTKRMLHEILYKKNLKVDGIYDIVNDIKGAEGDLRLNSKDIEKQARMPVKGDYILVFTGERTASWRLRAVDPFYYKRSKMEGIVDMEEIASYEKNVKLLVIDNKRRWFIGINNVSVGYKLYKIKDIRV